MNKSVVKSFLKYHETAWAPSTLKTETARLSAIEPLLGLAPKDLHEALQTRGQSPYTIKATLMRLATIEAWAVKQGMLSGPGVFSEYLRLHRNRLKHAYQRREVNVALEDVDTKLATLPRDIQPTVQFMLLTGLRISEVYKIQKDPRGLFVVGKGGKPRRIYGTMEVPDLASRDKVRRALTKVGLRPHDLRKIAATRLAIRGATAQDLCEVFGWNTVTTAFYYLQAKREDKLHELTKEAAGGQE